jgi:hypothetical protein
VVYGDVRIANNARINGKACYCFFQGIGEERYGITAYKAKGGITIVSDKLCCDLKAFEEQIKCTPKERYAREYMAMIEVIKAKFKL